MTTFTEAAHAAEFILSEGNGHRSRENGTLLNGQDLVVGRLVQLNEAGKLIAYSGAVDSADALVTEAAGILIYASHADGADLAVSYIARDAEVNGKLITHPTETGDAARAAASLALLGIIVR